MLGCLSLVHDVLEEVERFCYMVIRLVVMVEHLRQ